MGDLRSLIDGGRTFDIEDAVRIVLACCGAVGTEFPRGVISPEGILIAGDGGVTFGGDIMGHDLGYIAPEFGRGIESAPWPAQPVPLRVVDGNQRYVAMPSEPDLDRDRSIVFSLGAILWELVAGRRLYEGNTDYETLMLALVADVPPLRDVPPALEAIVRKALAKDLDARYQTAAELAADLSGWLDGER